VNLCHATGVLFFDELERTWKETVAAKSKYYPEISLENQRKTTKTL
jgi:hypothetical protein